jgi:hypothetical protein
LFNRTVFEVLDSFVARPWRDQGSERMKSADRVLSSTGMSGFTKQQQKVKMEWIEAQAAENAERRKCRETHTVQANQTGPSKMACC